MERPAQGSALVTAAVRGKSLLLPLELERCAELPGGGWPLIVHGVPRTKKNSLRMALNRSTGGRFPIQSKAAKRWEHLAVLQLQMQWGDLPALAEPVGVHAVVFRQRDVGDLNNYLAAIADALEHAGVLVNDKYIRNWDGSRLNKDALHPRVELLITRLQ